MVDRDTEKYGSKYRALFGDGIDRDRGDVRRSTPEWASWPRWVRRIYTQFEIYGASEDGIRSMCGDWKWKFDEVWGMCERAEGFIEKMDHYRETEKYWMPPHWKRNRLSRSLFERVYWWEGRSALLMRLEDRGDRQSAEHIVNYLAEEGLDIKSAEDKIEDSDKAPGTEVSAEEQDKIWQKGREVAPIINWEPLEVEKEA